MQNPLRRRTRALTAEQYDEVQKLVFDLVRERLVDAFGPTGMWTVAMKGVAEEHAVFNETVAESLAWDIAGQLAAPHGKNKHADAPVVKMPVEPSLVTPVAEPVEARAEQLVA